MLPAGLAEAVSAEGRYCPFGASVDGDLVSPAAAAAPGSERFPSGQ